MIRLALRKLAIAQTPTGVADELLSGSDAQRTPGRKRPRCAVIPALAHDAGICSRRGLTSQKSLGHVLVIGLLGAFVAWGWAGVSSDPRSGPPWTTPPLG